MTDQLEISILPKGEEKRATFYNQVNEWLRQEEFITSAKEQQSKIMADIVADHLKDNPSSPKGTVSSQVKMMINEELKSAATKQAAVVNGALADFAIAKKHFK